MVWAKKSAKGFLLRSFAVLKIIDALVKQNNLKKVLRLHSGYAELTTSGDGTFLPAGFPTLTSLASVTGRFAYWFDHLTLGTSVIKF